MKPRLHHLRVDSASRIPPGKLPCVELKMRRLRSALGCSARCSSVIRRSKTSWVSGKRLDLILWISASSSMRRKVHGISVVRSRPAAVRLERFPASHRDQRLLCRTESSAAATAGCCMLLHQPAGSYIRRFESPRNSRGAAIDSRKRSRILRSRADPLANHSSSPIQPERDRPCKTKRVAFSDDSGSPPANPILCGVDGWLPVPSNAARSR